MRAIGYGNGKAPKGTGVAAGWHLLKKNDLALAYQTITSSTHQDPHSEGLKEFGRTLTVTGVHDQHATARQYTQAKA